MKLRHLPLGGAALAFVLAFLLPLSHVQADKLIFGDGFVIEGMLKEKMSGIVDPDSGGSFPVPAAGLPYWLDDGYRYIWFPPFRLKEALKDREKKNEVRFSYTSPAGREQLPPNWIPESATDWNDKMEREVTLMTPGGKLKVKQRITSLSPQGMRVEASYYDWVSSYSIKELKPDTLRKLVYEFTGKGKNPPKELERRVKVYEFFLQAEMLDQAEQELLDMQRDFPGEKSTTSPLLSNLRDLFAIQVVEALEQADQAGLHHVVQSRLDVYTKKKLADHLDERSQLKVQALKDKMSLANQKLKDAQRLLEKFAGLVTGEKRDFFKQAAKDIQSELNPDTVGRLDTFLSLATDYERALKDKREPENTPADVMSLALTGWLRGSDAAEKSIDVAVKQWQGRLLLLEYLRCDNAAMRRDQLLPLLKDTISVDEAMQFIRLLPPVEPYDRIDTKMEEMQATAGKGVTYSLQLPPGYHHGRTWPVLIALHHSREKAAEAATRWRDLAAQHGYILAAPQWSQDKISNFQYTSAEHAKVLDTLTDLRRRFQVDSDRVFLFGLEQSGNMVWDVALSHPDQFAGAMPMCGTPAYFAKRYWTNAQLLNMYIVHGEKAPLIAETQKLFRDNFIRKSFPAIYAEYKGRPAGWYVGEQPVIFDWMNRKRRALPLKELGKEGLEFRTNRDGDLNFYWLSASSVAPNRILTPKTWNNQIDPGTLRAKVFNNNEIHVRAVAVNGVTLWFGPNMVNYADKVSLKLNDRPVTKHLITPSLDVLLERLYQTGDRQRMYFARFDWK